MAVQQNECYFNVMTKNGQTLVRDYVEAAWAFMATQNLIREPAMFVDAAMLDPSRRVTVGRGGRLGSLEAYHQYRHRSRYL
jgi:hypothetical protein